MGKKKKKFIDKKKAATFQLISRDSSDPNYSEDPSGDRVFVRVDGNSDKPFFDDDNNGIFDDAPEDYSDDESGGQDRRFEEQMTAGRLPGGTSLPDDVRREILELGFPDDGYNYLAHLREIRVTGGGSSFYQNPKARPDQLPRDVKAYDASRIDVSKANDEDSYKNSIYGVAVKTVPVRIQKAIDPEVAALLDDSDQSRFGSDVEDLEEDFVINANLPDESEDVELDNKLTSTEKSYANSKEDDFYTKPAQDSIVHNIASSETLVNAKPRERRPLDEQFDMLELQEYGTDDESEYDNVGSEDYECHDSLAEKLNNVPLEMDGNYKLLTNDKNIEEEPVTLETAADLRPRCMQYAEQFENENENDKEDVFLEESSDESEGWDCETIITTYSNLDNHPGKIEAPGGRRKKKLTETVNKAFDTPAHVITLKGKEMLPVDFLPHGRTSVTDVKDKNKPKNVPLPRKKLGQETKEEKKERKAAVKEEKREARRAKKDLKGLYKSEAQQAQKVAASTGPSSIHLM
ncbi:putative Low temperature viability protein Ltv1 [Helianthus debilis subsp. tardiflorus]